MRTEDDFGLTMEWFVAIAVAVVAFLLGSHGLWALSLCFTLVGQVLFLVLLVHTLDPARAAKRSADGEVPTAGNSDVTTGIR